MNRLGFPNFPQWNTPERVAAAKQKAPGIADLGELWHIDYMLTDPVTFWASVKGHADTLTEPDRGQYIKTIKEWTQKRGQKVLVENLFQLQDWGIHDWVILNLFPELWEWSNSWKIAKDFNTYIDVVLHIWKNHPFPSEKDRQAFAKRQRKMTVDYGGKEWFKAVTPERAAAYAEIFFPPDVMKAEGPSFAGPTGKWVGFGLVALIGTVGIISLVRKRKG